MLTVAPWSAGSEFLSGGIVAFRNERTVAAYEKLRELNQTDAVLTGAPTDWWDPSAFTQGLAAMQWSGLWALPAIRQALGDDVGVMAWPALDKQGRPATFLGGWSAMVNGASKHVDEAKRYMKWLWIDNAQAQRDWCLDYGFHVPPRLSVAKIADKLRAPLAAEAVGNMMRYGRFQPAAWSNSMQTALTDALTNIVKKGGDAADEVRIAAERCEEELQYELD